MKELNWTPVVKSFFLAMEKAGFSIEKVRNDDEWVNTPDLKAAISETTATDEAYVSFKAEGEKHNLWAFIVLGNSPSELVCDYAYRDSEQGKKFDASVIAWADSWEGKDCPTKREKKKK